MAATWDVVLAGGAVIDGSGAPARVADVALRGDRVAAVGADLVQQGRAGRTVRVDGMVVAPGFVDVHTHDDFAVVLGPDMAPKVHQGVTTVVVGNCGMSVSPFDAAEASAFGPGCALPRWDGIAGYLAHLDAEPASVNVAVLAGHNTIRSAAMGEDRSPAGPRQLDAMVTEVEHAMAAGAVGLSTGLIYRPGCWAPSEEIHALAAVMAGSGARYASHIRDEGLGLVGAVAEAIAVGRATGVGVQISHHKARFPAWGLVARSLELIDRARAEGLDVAADQYPYTAGSTLLAAVMAVIGPNDMTDQRAGQIAIAAAPGHPEWEGRTVKDLAEVLSCPPWGAAQRALDDCGPGVWAVVHEMDETDVRTVLAHPSTMIGSDGIPAGGKPHPRLYGTFPRVLGRYVRDLGVLALPEAVHRMTGMAAAAFGLADRGAVRAGALADLVVFDPALVEDTATFEHPKRHPEGISSVWVNGTEVVRGGVHTGARPGHALRRSA